MAGGAAVAVVPAALLSPVKLRPRGGCVVIKVDLQDTELVGPGIAEDPEVVAALLLVVPRVADTS